MVPVFSSKLEIEVFNALLDPRAVEFDAARMIETQEKVRTGDIAAVEMTTLIQIAYGGQPEVFTDAFRAALAEEIYAQPEPTINLYNDFRNFDWQNTINQFSGVVGVLADHYPAPLLVPSNDIERNNLLADLLTDSLTNTYQAVNGALDESVSTRLYGMAVYTGTRGVAEHQIALIAGGMAAGFDPPAFGNALEAEIYNFAKGDLDFQIDRSEQVVDYICRSEHAADRDRVEIAEQVEIEKQTIIEEQFEIEIEEQQSNGLAM